MVEALREALVEEMRRDSRVICWAKILACLAVSGARLPLRSVWKKEFGHDRVLDTPISEAAIAGVASGCSLWED